MLQRASVGALALLASLMIAGCGTGAKPAATVNGHDISMSAYTQQVYYVRQVAVDSGGIDQCQPGSPAADCLALKSGALTDLIDNELVNEYAAAHHIAVSNADFNREWAQIWQVRFQHNPAMLKAFSQRMRISQSDVKARVREDMLRQAVENQVVPAMTGPVPAMRAARIFTATKKQTDAVQAQIRAHIPFLRIAQSLTKDVKSPCAEAGNCGDSGWLPDALLQPYERFLTKEPVNKPLGPYRLQQGYEFYVVEGKSPRHATSPDQQAALRALAFSKWLLTQEHRSSIKRNVPA